MKGSNSDRSVQTVEDKNALTRFSFFKGQYLGHIRRTKQNGNRKWRGRGVELNPVDANDVDSDFWTVMGLS